MDIPEHQAFTVTSQNPARVSHVVHRHIDFRSVPTSCYFQTTERPVTVIPIGVDIIPVAVLTSLGGGLKSHLSPKIRRKTVLDNRDPECLRWVAITR